MRRLLVSCLVVALTALGWSVPVMTASATPPAIQVGGTGVAMYPAFDPQIHRYGITTTSATLGTVTVTVPAGSTVNGAPAAGDVTLTGLTDGDEIAVGIGGVAYGLVYLPAQFPAMVATGTPTFTGYLGVGLTTFGTPLAPAFEALLDSNGVPAWVDSGTGNDFKRQPTGELTLMRPTTSSGAGYTGSDLVTLDDHFAEVARRHVVGDVPPLTDTDNHDSERLPDGSTILIGYEPRGPVGTGFLDATIEKTDAAGQVVFQWSSEGLEAETLNPLPWPQGSPSARIDYAHINSVQEIPDGSHDLLVSFRHFSSVYRISTDPSDNHANHVIWKLGGRHSSFTFAGGDGGPCAQHDATWIGDNRILLYDNGSTALGTSAAGCVDPLAPLGPGIARTYTRVSEYVLDTGAGTATLDWSYLPANTFTFFAGAATRLDDGDTVIGWASDRKTLATEVDHAATPASVWSLAIPGNTSNLGYTSYRVSVVPYTDAIAPVVTLDQVDNATYVSDESPRVPLWTCSDRGGSTLTSCTVSGLVGNHLSTTPGTHTVSVTARDGAGNTTTSTRHYTVLAAHQPDGLIRKTSTWKGSDVYGAATDQTIRQRAHRGHTVTSYWRVQNDGTRGDALALTGTRGDRRFRVHFFAGRTDVTRAVVAGTYRTASLAPGAWATLRVEVTPTVHARAGGVRTVTMTAVSSEGSGDSVAARVVARG